MFQILDFLKPNKLPTDTPPRTFMNMEDLKEFMNIVDKISIKHGLTQND